MHGGAACLPQAGLAAAEVRGRGGVIEAYYFVSARGAFTSQLIFPRTAFEFVRKEGANEIRDPFWDF